MLVWVFLSRLKLPVPSSSLGSTSLISQSQAWKDQDNQWFQEKSKVINQRVQVSVGSSLRFNLLSRGAPELTRHDAERGSNSGALVGQDIHKSRRSKGYDFYLPTKDIINDQKASFRRVCALSRRLPRSRRTTLPQALHRHVSDVRWCRIITSNNRR